jgi:hypothetical protein
MCVHVVEKKANTSNISATTKHSLLLQITYHYSYLQVAASQHALAAHAATSMPPQSHCSPLSTTPSPHTAPRQL